MKAERVNGSGQNAGCPYGKSTAAKNAYRGLLIALLAIVLLPANGIASVHYCPGEPYYFTDEITRDEAWKLKCRLVEGSPMEEEHDPPTDEEVSRRRTATPLATRMSAVESKPSAKLRAFYRIADRVSRVQQLAWTAGACRIRSTGWYIQVRQLYYMGYENELAKQKFSIEELAVIYKRTLVATRKALKDFPLETSCTKLGQSSELAEIDLTRQRATLNYH